MAARNTKILVDGHFKLFSSPTHPVKPGFLAATKALECKPAQIIETGSSAWGADSTRLWAKYVRVFGGALWSVDLRDEPREALGYLGPNVHLCVDDSVEFLKRFKSTKPGTRADLVYLDSYDVDWENPEPAAYHCYREWELLQPLTESGSVVVIDDSPKSPSDVAWLKGKEAEAVAEFFAKNLSPPGKGTFVFEEVSRSRGWKILHHSYNLVLQKR